MKKGTKFFLIAAGLLFLGYAAVPMELYFGFPEPQKLKLPKTLPEQITEEQLDVSERYTVDGQTYLRGFGELLPFRIRRPKQAYLAIAALSDVLGIEDVRNDLRYEPLPRSLLTTAYETVEGHYYVFMQYYGDIPVDGGSILLFADRQNHLTELYSSYVPDISLETTEPKLTAEEAERIAAKHELNETSREHETELVVASDAERGAVLAWKVYFDTLLSDAVRVDACTGEIIADKQSDSTESEP